MTLEMNPLSKLLDDFYGLYSRTGNGIIVNHKLGADLYNKVDKELYKLEIDQSIKNEIWNECKKWYSLFYDQYKNESKEFKKELLHNYYKSELIAYHMNSLLKSDGTGEIISF